MKDEGGKGAGRWGELVGVALVALCGLAGAGLWLWAAWQAWPGVMLQRRVNHQETVSVNALLAVQERSMGLERAVWPGRHVHQPGDVGQLLLMESEFAEGAQTDLLREVEGVTRAALVRDPAYPRGWARLAWLIHLRRGPAGEVLDALRLSIYTAPANRMLIMWRIQLAGLYRSSWDAPFESLIRRQIHIAAKISRTSLDQAAASAGIEDWVEQVLRDMADQGG